MVRLWFSLIEMRSAQFLLGFFFKVDLLAKFSDVKRKNLIAKCLPQLLENCGSEEDRKVLTPAAFSGGFWCRQMI